MKRPVELFIKSRIPRTQRQFSQISRVGVNKKTLFDKYSLVEQELRIFLVWLLVVTVYDTVLFFLSDLFLKSLKVALT